MPSRKNALGAVVWVLSVLLLPSRVAASDLNPQTDTLRFEAVFKTYLVAEADSRERKQITKDMQTLDGSYYQWLAVHKHPRVETKLRFLALEKLIEKCNTAEECDDLWAIITGDLKTIKKLFKKLLTVSKTTKEFFSLYKRIYFYDSDMESRTRKALLKSGPTLEESTAICVFASERHLNDLESDCLNKIKKSGLAAPFDTWINIALSLPRNSRLRKFAIDRMS